MERLPNDRNEAYARHRANGLIPAKSAIAAGYATGSAIYTELEKNAEVQARISTLILERQTKRETAIAQARAATADDPEAQKPGTRAWIRAQLIENATAAREDGDFKEANNALRELLIMDNKDRELDPGNQAGTPAPPDADHLAAILSATERLSAPGVALMDSHQVNSILDAQPKVPTEDRVLTTGSETDVVLQRE